MIAPLFLAIESYVWMPIDAYASTRQELHPGRIRLSRSFRTRPVPHLNDAIPRDTSLLHPFLRYLYATGTS